MTPQWKHSRLSWLVVAAILILHLGLGFISALQKSATYDEPTHLAGGYMGLKYGEYLSNPEGGQLAQRWAALPLLAMNIENPIEPPVEKAGKKKYSIKSYNEGNKILSLNGMGRPYALALPRLMILLASAGFGLLLFLWSRAIWGPTGGIFTVAVYGFSPTILAHARLVTADLFGAGFMVLAVLAVWRVLHRLSIGNLILAGLSVGGAILAKFSGLMIGPMAVIMAAGRFVVGRPLIISLPQTRRIVRSRWNQLPLYFFSAIIVLLLAWAAVWLAYGFRFSAAAQDLAISSGPMRYETVPPFLEMLYAWKLLPESFLYGLSFTLDFMGARAAFMNGKYSATGWLSFFPYAILIKTALPILILTAISPILLFYAKRRKRTIYALIPLIVLAGVVLTVAITGNLNIGHRHVLPLYPVLAVFAGSASILFSIATAKVRQLGMMVCGGLLLWLVAVSLGIWPHYLAYFNPLIGGPSHGYKHLVDSSLDWGQDLRGLTRWLHENPQNEPNKPLYLLYFGSTLPKHERIYSGFEGLQEMVNLMPPSRSYFPENAVQRNDYLPGRYCISATELQRTYAPMRGPWTPEREAAYQRTAPIAQAYFNRQSSPQLYQKMVTALGFNKIAKVVTDFGKLRFGRLLAYLRHQEPDAMIGYSILVYDLTQEEINGALYGPGDSLMP